MSEQEKKQQRIYDLLNTGSKAKVSLFTLYKTKKIFLQKKGRLKSSYNISAVDDFFDQWVPSTAILTEEVFGPQEGLHLK